MQTATHPQLAIWQQQYAQLRRRLAQTHWISEGYVQNRGPGAGGPCYKWTRKVKGKTVSVALSKEQYKWLCSATSDENGSWPVEVTPDLPKGYAQIFILGGDDSQFVENSLMLIAAGIQARITPEEEPHPLETPESYKEDYDKLIGIIKAICSQDQLRVIYKSFPELPESFLQHAQIGRLPTNQLPTL